MTTISEELTAKIAQKFFFETHIYSNVFYVDDDGEKELCDVLIEFVDFYVCIEVKEKNKSSTSDDWTWFNNKVLHKGIKQAKKAINSIKQATTKFYIELEDKKKKYLDIDSGKSIIPLIVFYNCQCDNNNKFFEADSLNHPINIFSYEDFCIMLNTIIIPYDIVGYLLQRSEYIPQQGGKRVIFEDLTDDITLLSAPQTEKDYAEMYLVKNYYSQDISPEYISFYNEFLSNIYNNYGSAVPELFEMLFSADTILANRIVAYYCSTLERLKSKEWDVPLFAYNKSDCGIMFTRKPFLSTNEEFDNYLNNFCTYFAFKHNLGKIYALLFVNATEDTFTISIGGCKFNPALFDAELEATIKEIDKKFGIDA